MQDTNLDLRPITLHQRLTKVEQHAEAMLEWKQSIDDSTATQREMVMVGRDIIATLHVLGWLGRAVKWLATIVAASAAGVTAIKHWGHLGF